IARDPKDRAVVALQISANGGDPVEGARQDGLAEREVRKIPRRTIAGLPAAQLIAQDREVRMHLTWIAYRNHVFRVAGVSPPRAFETYREVFVRAASSFRPLRRDER